MYNQWEIDDNGYLRNKTGYTSIQLYDAQYTYTVRIMYDAQYTYNTRTVYVYFGTQCVYIVRRTLYIVRCAMYSVHRTLCNVQCTSYITMYAAQCMYTVRVHSTSQSVRIIYDVHCTLHSVRCTVYDVHCTLHSVRYTVYDA